MSDTFPLDDATLLMLIGACQLNPDTGQTHLHDFLMMGAREATRTDITHEMGADWGAGPPVYEVEYEDGYCPYSPHDAIVALAEEVLRLRGVTP